ncbi:hypothetical protein BAY61_31300 [Prauserella marina]|uniref:Uncharacterized protein n=1 Tax=Prauserella marina TaxID=530584 RepID=A0A222VXW6_9PSEU|nr:hypothetical protein [Prauserella marina]ASR38744.1 hypothetical protein BAY61_31300 [Prauserella marina]PWV82096.1 hypothetical protein DES30_102332 [Prauserella marina]SDD19292.1 hypothetical protein SAMN05421630_106332 [Prauserella marina]
MWVDESGGADATDTTGTSDEMTITVEGEDYSADVNFDIDEDGTQDTAVIEHEDGSLQAFVDVDGDGHADEYIQLDAQGQTLAYAEYDEASGDWVSTEEGAPPGDDTDTQTGSGGTITADMPDGDMEVGPATIDTNDDGVNDTATVTDEQGNTYAFTDEDGDGQADVAVVVDSTGNSVTYEHTGDGEWTEQGTAPAGTGSDSDSLWGGGDQDTAVEGVARIDSGTGLWMSQN